jgi:hypothetical protein
MPIPTLITDLSTTAVSNSPAGSDTVFPDLDNYVRALSAFLASIRDNSGNGWTSPYATTSAASLTSGTLDVARLTLVSPPAIGGTTPNAITGTNITATGNLYANGSTSLIGYTTGSGGTVTQTTSKSTGVTINKSCGTITTHNENLNAITEVVFTVTNSQVSAGDVVVVSPSATGSTAVYTAAVQAVAAGSFQIRLRNNSGANNYAEAVQINFAVINSVTS